MSRPQVIWAAVAALLATGLCACGHSAPTTLRALIATPPTTVYPTYAAAPLEVGEVRLPAPLDRIELLKEIAPGRFEVREFDRWAAPPSRLARQALTEDLALRLPAGAVITAGAGGTSHQMVSVEVLSFKPGPQKAVLSAIWTRGCHGAPSVRAYLRLDAEGSNDVPGALSALIAQLSDRIAEQVASTPLRSCDEQTSSTAP